jgi:pantoate--beta-alanine ligase
MAIRVLDTQEALNLWRGEVHRDRRGVLVPTMGALHEGHASLIRQAVQVAASRGEAGGVIVSIFVNPTQFNDPADFARYPKTLDADLALCESAGATAVFVPSVVTIYPQGQIISPPPLPAVAREPGLEDARRPGHFAGVAQVVKRLFEIVRPAAAIFGEKDWQQLQVVRAMTHEQGLGVEIIPGPTIRENDGLAMSSRNRFLTAEERGRAGAISWALCVANKAETIGEAERLMRTVLHRAGMQVEYAVVREAASLRAVSRVTLNPRFSGHRPRPMRALIAARLGSVRLIDNTAWGG